MAVTSLAKAVGADGGENKGSLLQDLKYSIVVDIDQDDFGIRNRLYGFCSPSNGSTVKDEKLGKSKTSSTSTSTSTRTTADYKGQPPWMVSRWKILKQIEENRRREEMEKMMREESAFEDAVHSLFDVNGELSEDPVTRQTMCTSLYTFVV